jgi:hypothetical protein
VYKYQAASRRRRKDASGITREDSTNILTSIDKIRTPMVWVWAAAALQQFSK